MKIDIIYIARGADWGVETAQKFFKSYMEHPAGCEHNLLVAAKAWENDPQGYEKLKQLAQSCGAKIVDLPDDGFCFGAHFRAAQLSDADYIFPMTSTSQILQDDWLLKFKKAFEENKKLKHAGTGGFWALLNEPSIKDFINENSKRKFGNKKSLARSIYKKLEYLKDIDLVLKEKFQPPFPNYLIRSNAYMICRKMYLEFMEKYGIPKNKFEACQLESGVYKGLSKFVERKGFKIGVLGADGRLYKKHEWPESKTGFAPDLSNVIIKDWHYDNYLSADPQTKLVLDKWAWENGPPPPIEFFETMKKITHKT
jgi:hypothetical protein